TAPERQQTLNATLDWSYNLLSEAERMVLRRLSVFAGRFSLDVARQVVANGTLSQAEVLEALNGLIAKSLLSADSLGRVAGFRLLETTRTYAAAKLFAAGEVDTLRQRQAEYYRDRLGEISADLQINSAAVTVIDDIDNLRATLNWAFGRKGDAKLGAQLAAN